MLAAGPVSTWSESHTHCGTEADRSIPSGSRTGAMLAAGPVSTWSESRALAVRSKFAFEGSPLKNSFSLPRNLFPLGSVGVSRTALSVDVRSPLRDPNADRPRGSPGRRAGNVAAAREPNGLRLHTGPLVGLIYAWPNDAH
jgi:hypothetical protein